MKPSFILPLYLQDKIKHSLDRNDCEKLSQFEQKNLLKVYKK